MPFRTLVAHVAYPTAAAALLALGPAPTAVAAPATCLGQAATITADGGPVVGTAGDDVISTTGDVVITALGGNDRICLERGSVDAGPGDDGVASGIEGQPNLTGVHLGPGQDFVALSLPDGSHASVDSGGADQGDRLSIVGSETAAGDWAMDLGGSVSRDGEALATFTGFGYHDLMFGAAANVAVTGTNGPDAVALSAGRFDLDLRGGDDRLYSSGRSGPVSGHADAGDGQDELWALAGDVDLVTGEVDLGDGVLQVDSFEDLTFEADRIRLRGSAADEKIHVLGCDVRVNGGGGGDTISYWPRDDSGCTKYRILLQGGSGRDRLSGSRKEERLEGGKGNDRLDGERNGDTLIGGPGRDRADGGGGANDVCQAEVEKRCER